MIEEARAAGEPDVTKYLNEQIARLGKRLEEDNATIAGMKKPVSNNQTQATLVADTGTDPSRLIRRDEPIESMEEPPSRRL